MKKSWIATALLPLVCTLLGSCGSGASRSNAEPEVTENGTRMTVENSAVMFDNDTELETGIHGFAVENIYIVDGDDKKISSHEVALNTRFSVIYEGIKNYSLKNGKAFPALSIRVMDNDQHTVISEADLLASYSEGLSEADASVLRATVTVGDPMKPGKYMCTIQVTDKNNTDSAILSTWSFDVK